MLHDFCEAVSSAIAHPRANIGAEAAACMLANITIHSMPSQFTSATLPAVSESMCRNADDAIRAFTTATSRDQTLRRGDGAWHRVALAIAVIVAKPCIRVAVTMQTNVVLGLNRVAPFHRLRAKYDQIKSIQDGTQAPHPMLSMKNLVGIAGKPDGDRRDLHSSASFCASFPCAAADDQFARRDDPGPVCGHGFPAMRKRVTESAGEAV